MMLDWTRDRGTVSTLVLGAAFLAYFLYKRFSRAPIKVPAEAVAVGTVTQLRIYPVKSMQAMPDVAGVRAVTEGFVTDDNDDIRDRAWMVVGQTGVFVSQRAEPKLALISPSVPFGGDMLHLEAPGVSTLKTCKYMSSRTAKVVDVSVWGQHLQAVDCGEEAADWIATYLGRPGFRLVYMPPEMAGRKPIESKRPLDQAFREEDRIVFSDAAPILLLSESTVSDVNARVGDDTNITLRNFRPNIVVSGVQEPYGEDTWQDIYIGQVKMTHVRQCDRCTLTTVDPDTAEKNKNEEPLLTLRKYRPAAGKAPYVGIFLNVIQDGAIKVGDTVYATRRKS